MTKGIFLRIKKSQFKIQEMSFMIIGVFIFFSLVLVFYLVFSMSNLKQDVQQSSKEKAILLVSSLAGIPEFSCSQGGMLCVDTDKVIAMLNNPAYATFWDVEGLRIERIYPIENKTVPCTFTNYPKCNVYTIVKQKSASITEASSFVSLCRKEFKSNYHYDQCDIGKIIVSIKK